MLNSSSSKVFFVVLITLLVQVFLFTSTTFISTALAGGGGSNSGGSSSSGGSSNDDDRFTWDGFEAINTGLGTTVKTFPKGNVGLTVGDGGGDTKFYSNGDGTWNSITYPSNNNGGGSNNNNNPNNPTDIPTCPSGYEFNSNGSCVPIYYPPTVSISANPSKVKYKTPTTLSWSSSNASSCSAGGGWSGGKGTSGSESTIELVDPTTFAIQCTDNIQTASAAVTVDIEYGVGAEIDAPDVVRKDTPTDVTWDVGTSETRNCQLEAGSVILLPAPLPSEKGTFTHIVTAETTFTLNCEDYHNTDEKTVEVLPEFQET